MMTDQVPVATQFQWKSTSFVFGDENGEVLCSVSSKVLEQVAISVHMARLDGADPCTDIALRICGEIQKHLDNYDFEPEFEFGSLADRVKALLDRVQDES